ncbi:hypothetical protein HF521_003659 [Silurus meridionalis]|uniref:Transmembrane protein 243 n=2 Tax=Silurus TaxID=94992 RepID=A0A8T0AYZ7_SILME|nr:hypothetical protein HF521_003659 [Silurus meridionalis]
MTRISVNSALKMDEHIRRSYGTEMSDSRLLFGETSTWNRIVYLAVGGFTSVFVIITIISSFVFPTPAPNALNVFFGICIIMICSSVLVLIFWYRQGDLEPRFKHLIYYTIASIILLCLCANLYFHDVGR